MQAHAAVDLAGEDLDKAVLAELIGDGLEHKAERGVAALVLRSGDIVQNALQHGGGAHVGHTVGGVDGNDAALLDTDLQTFNDIGLVELHGLKELLHQLFGGAGGGLHQLGAQLFHGVGVGGGDSALLDLVATGGIGHVMHQVNDAGAVGLGDRDGADAAAVLVLQRVESLGVVAVLLAALGDREHHGQVGGLQIVPAALGADGDGLGRVLGGDGDYAGLDRAQGVEHLADKVEVAGAVEHVDLVAVELHRRDSRGDGDLAGDLFGIIVADGVAVSYLAQTVDGAGDVEHALGQAGLAGVAVAQEGDVTDVFCFVAHVLLPL